MDGWMICYHVRWVAENWAGIERRDARLDCISYGYGG
jgi:hypothetical protein